MSILESRVGNGMMMLRPFPKEEHPSLREIYIYPDRGEPLLVVGTGYPDSFTISWQDGLRDLDSFFAVCCSFIDSFKGQKLPVRPWMIGEDNSIMLSPGQKATVYPSYSENGYNHVWMSGENFDAITFDELPWPFTLSDLKQAAIAQGGTISDTPDDFVRIDAEFLSILLNAEPTFEKSITVWSHVFPGQALLQFYKQTSMYKGNVKRVRDIVNLLIAPRFDYDGSINGISKNAFFLPGQKE